MSSIEGILWDFGGVITSSPFERFNDLEERVGAPRDFIRGVNSTNPDTNAWAQFEANAISLEAFDELFLAEATAAGHPIAGKDVIACLSGSIRPRMVEVLQTCKSKFRIGCITNNVKAGVGPGMTENKGKANKVADVMAMFDIVVESSIEGVRKPNPRIYEIATQRLQVDPARCIFLDDLGINLKPARAMGMQTIKVVSEAQAIAELEQLTGIAFP